MTARDIAALCLGGPCAALAIFVYLWFGHLAAVALGYVQ